MAFVSPPTECIVTTYMRENKNSTKNEIRSALLRQQRSFFPRKLTVRTVRKSPQRDDLRKCYNIQEYIRNDVSHPQLPASRQHTRYRQQVKYYTSKTRKKQGFGLDSIKVSTPKDKPQQPHTDCRNVQIQSRSQSNIANVHTNHHRWIRPMHLGFRVWVLLRAMRRGLCIRRVFVWVVGR